LTRTTGDNVSGDSASAVKTWVDAKISISPLTPTNEVGVPHTFTITAKVDNGDGLGLVNAPNGTQINLSKSGPGNLGAATCTINSGTCTVTVTSAGTGAMTVTAGMNVLVGPAGNQITLTRTTGDNVSGDSASAVKTWVDAKISISPLTPTNEVGIPHTFTITAKVDNGDGSGLVNVPDGTTINISKTGVGTLGAATCTTSAGVCTVTVSSGTTGSMTVTASMTVQAGPAGSTIPVMRTTGDGLSGDSASAVKTWVDAQISISPLAPVNAIGIPHTFTITAKVDNGDGAGLVNAPNGTTINLSKTGVGTLGASTCTIASGICTVVVTSSTTGTTTVTAGMNVLVGPAGNQITLTRTTGDNLSGDSASAVKTWVDGGISITPPTATNQVGSNHTLTITVAGVNGVIDPGTYTATASITNDATATATFVGSNKCTYTNTDTTCTVVISSPTTGLTTISATSTFNVNGQPVTRTTGDGLPGDSPNALKTWVDAKISISPLAPVNEVGTPHTFTVTAKVDNGDGLGFVNVPDGTTINLTKSGVGSLGSSTCVTSAGACTVTVSSSSTGQMTVTASMSIQAGPAGGKIPVTRTTGDGLSGDSGNAVKTWVDAKISISPLTPTNEVGIPHTFTVTAKVDNGDGSGFVNAPDGTVINLSKSGNGTLGSPTCTINSGTCTVTVSSAGTGSMTVTAGMMVNAGPSGNQISLTRTTGDNVSGDSASAVKTWVDSYITLTPAVATNNVTVTHTFTATVFQNDGSGSGYVAATGVTVTFSFVGTHVGSFTAGTTCVTGAGGSCTITTSSTTAGDDTVQATANVTVGGVTMTRTTGTTAPGHANDPNAVKHWVKPSIGITKNPKSQTITSGGTASFTIVVTNTGTVTLTNVHVTDALSPDCNRTSAQIAGLASMAPGATVTYTCSLAGVTASFTNSATATGTPVGGGPDVSATDTAPVTVNPGGGGGGGGTPAISITKNPKTQSIASGATANFTITVTNTGTLVLSNVSVSDPLSPNCNQTSASIPALGSMAPGASVTYNCSLANVTASFTNVATATGTGSNGQTVTANDSAPVTVQAITPPTPPVVPAPTPHAAIGIVKDPKSQTIGQGGTASFTITVTNTGDVTLSNVTVADPLSPNCDKSLGTLAVGQSKHYSCTKPNVNADFRNVATATGKPPTTAAVKATDHANITVKPFLPPQHPRIAIVKSPKNQTLTTRLHTVKSANGSSKTTVTYGTAKFTIKVTNTGDVTLHNVHVTDPASTNCNKTIGTLASHASKTYSCTRTTVRSNFTNVATAHGTSPKGKNVQATDHANVKVTIKTTSTSGAQFTG
ncbi:MAG TPA: hypothetical protein VH063_12390, partial [Gaiellaceae bacterium]|nr:hypothetical protein [Gaiellaceae bacterium]